MISVYAKHKFKLWGSLAIVFGFVLLGIGATEIVHADPGDACELSGATFGQHGTQSVGWYTDQTPGNTNKRKLNLKVTATDCTDRNLRVEIWNKPGGSAANDVKIHEFSVQVPANSSGDGTLDYTFDVGETGCKTGVAGLNCHLYMKGFVDSSIVDGGFDSYAPPSATSVGTPNGVTAYSCDNSNGITPICEQAFVFPAFTPPTWLSTGGNTGSLLNTGQEFQRLTNPIGFDNIPDVIRQLVKIVFVIGVPLVALAIIYAGFLLVTAGGNQEKIKAGKSALLAAVIGGAILLGAWVIAEAIQGTVDQIRGGS